VATPVPVTPSPQAEAGADEPEALPILEAIILQPINLRQGPGTDYPVLSVAMPDERYPILGRNPAGDWWQIAWEEGEAWLYAPLVRAVNGEGVPVAEAPALPTPQPLPTATPAPEGQPPADPAPAATAAPVQSQTASQPDVYAPAPAPVGTVVVYETSVTIPTYPMQAYQSQARNEQYNWPYLRFDRDRFRQENPAPQSRSYRLLVLENAYLRVTVLPELGGRIWQAIHKPSGGNMFYQNPVVKPSPWGPTEQLGWVAAGGMEWALPVIEHGYDWGSEWGFLPLQHSGDLASITIFTPQDGRFLNASITISLRSGAASFEVEPTISNVSAQALSFSYWQTAMLAPGVGNQPSGATRLYLPGSQMTVHSTQDPRLPGEEGAAFNWPMHNGVDYSWLGNWNQYLGFFERPAAQGPYVGVFDHQAQAGAVRVFPAGVARGSKVFSAGFNNALGADLYTDDGSRYVELHGGLAPTFMQEASLPPGGSVSWREIWYPVTGIDGIRHADEVRAIQVRPSGDGLWVGIYPTRPLGGVLRAVANGQELARMETQIRPDQPFTGVLIPAGNLPDASPVEIRMEDGRGQLYFTYSYQGPLR
jgi:uncharacterized protein YraI